MTKKPKEVVTVVKVRSTKYFYGMSKIRNRDARDYAIKLLEAGLTFFEINKEEIEE